MVPGQKGHHEQRHRRSNCQGVPGQERSVLDCKYREDHRVGGTEREAQSEGPECQVRPWKLPCVGSRELLQLFDWGSSTVTSVCG